MPEIKRTIDDILRSNECNTYVMSCYLTRDDLYKSMRGDLAMACEEIERMRVRIAELEKAEKALDEIAAAIGRLPE